MTTQRLYLSPPHMSGHEQGYVQQVFDSNWIAPLGSLLDSELRDGLATVGGMM